MAQYPLTEKQKTLLTSLVPGLRTSSIGHDWAVTLGARTAAIFETGRVNLRSLGWNTVQREDFDQFVAHGFFSVTKHNHRGEPSNYSLNEERIIQAVENGFPSA